MKIDHYLIEEEIARGGQGIVYRGLDERSGARVVVKLLRVEGEQGRRRLQREAAAMARLVHPSVVTLYDSGLHNGSPYLVLPFIRGESLQDQLDREGPRPLEEVIEIAIQVCEGLQAAHQIGLLHRDVKPANVLIDHRLGNAKLTDFGLVKDLNRGASTTLSLSVGGHALGTPGYWPPEQALGRVAEIGPPADVYGVGGLMYALLSGGPPRSAENLIQAIAALDQPVPSLAPDAPPWLDDLVQRCLEVDPAHRPTLESVLGDLRRRGEHALRQQPQASRSGTPWIALATVSLVAFGVVCLAAQLRSPTSADDSAGRRPPVVRPAPAPDAADSDSVVQPRDVDPGGEDSEPAVALDPHWARAYLLEGRSKGELGQYAEAIKDFTKAIQLDPQLALAYFNRGVCNASLKRYLEAIADYDRAVDLDPRMVSGYYNRGCVKARLGRDVEASRDYSRAIELDSGHVNAFYNRGLSNENLGDYEGAIRDYDRVLELDPNRSDAYVNRGRCNAQLDRHEEAVEDSTKALALEQSALSYTNRGISKQWLDRFEEAIEDFNEAVALDPHHAEAYSHRGFCRARLGQSEAALADYEQALELDPTDATIYFNRGNLKTVQLERHSEAIEDFTRALEVDSNFALAYSNRGRCLSLLGRQAEAIRDLSKAIELSPQSAMSFVLRGMCKAGLGRFTEALEDFDRGLSIEPANATALLYRGSCRAELQQNAQALEDFDKALALGLPEELADQARELRASVVATERGKQ